ncbi:MULTISPECIES: DUF423 domain-containing protein [unclassified Haematospirillum]|uniref:DUF423 domain-containing protein n=1 Tax=unclassified Haematospirillum TaxID=2622088 RepID=UPI00143A7B63|nr:MULTISPECIES: DUF423 domain-containing protein [unclassified Haematospirillum]NKD54429.1 DUF423 domain-containing protein [Haematospirillum sp. H4890]NKD74472.1 DUF423 domain-containing protein [Haematospirillum sp. H4485]NKD86857.1 DUF423 domain-containing protein [Haematospirillum sp. 15-248]
MPLMMIWASVNGFVAIILAAWASHGGVIEGSYESSLITKASYYQLVHSTVIMWVAILAERSILFRIAGLFFGSGQILFCGSLYLIAFLDVPADHGAPLGGISFMAGWVMCVFAGAKHGAQGRKILDKVGEGAYRNAQVDLDR